MCPLLSSPLLSPPLYTTATKAPFGDDDMDVDFPKIIRRIDKYTASLLSFYTNGPVENYNLYPESRSTDEAHRKTSKAVALSSQNVYQLELRRRAHRASVFNRMSVRRKSSVEVVSRRTASIATSIIGRSTRESVRENRLERHEEMPLSPPGSPLAPLTAREVEPSHPSFEVLSDYPRPRRKSQPTWSTFGRSSPSSRVGIRRAPRSTLTLPRRSETMLKVLALPAGRRVTVEGRTVYRASTSHDVTTGVSPGLLSEEEEVRGGGGDVDQATTSSQASNRTKLKSGNGRQALQLVAAASRLSQQGGLLPSVQHAQSASKVDALPTLREGVAVSQLSRSPPELPTAPQQPLSETSQPLNVDARLRVDKAASGPHPNGVMVKVLEGIRDDWDPPAQNRLSSPRDSKQPTPRDRDQSEPVTDVVRVALRRASAHHIEMTCNQGLY